MRILLDTNRLTDALRQDQSITDLVEQALEVWIPFVTLGEIQAGFQGGHPRRRAHNETLLLRFLRLPAVGVLYPDRETTGVYARLFVELRQAGTPIPTNDLWIASLAVQHQVTLVTRDAHFSKIPQISRL
jgi:tRNA(fMet)-specific endonuclease VapC